MKVEVYDEGASTSTGGIRVSRGLKGLAVITTVFMFLVVFVGTMVTKTGSGDGCGRSWPLCEGQFLPQANINSMIEYSHRVVSGIVGILITVLLVWAWRACKGRRDARFLVAASFLFTAIQALLGAAAVVWGQSPPIMALHFGVSLVAFATVLLFTLILFRWESRPVQMTFTKGYRNALFGVTAYTYVVVYTGAYVVHGNASGGCGRWFPLCDGKWFPGFSGAAGIQFVHRLSAFLLMVAVLALLVVTLRRYKERRDLYLAGVWSGALVVLQILSGGLMMWAGLNLFTRLLHATLIMLLFGALSYMCMEVFRRPPQETDQADLIGKPQARPSVG